MARDSEAATWSIGGQPGTQDLGLLPLSAFPLQLRPALPAASFLANSRGPGAESNLGSGFVSPCGTDEVKTGA